MTWDWESIISGAVSGGAIGGLVTLITPWSIWGVEKKRKLVDARKNRIRNWRSLILNASMGLPDGSNPIPFRVKLVSFPDYRDLRAHLPTGLAREIETEWPDGMVESENELRDLVLDEIKAIELKWGLI